jgi:hypothetical protein
MTPVTKILSALTESMISFPNIEPGQDFSGYR